MTLPAQVRKHVDEVLKEFCEQREVLNAREHEQVEYKIEGNYVTITDSRPVSLSTGKWSRNKIAFLEFNVGVEKWKLHWYDKNAKRHLYPVKVGVDSLDDLIKTVETDCTGIFGS